MPHSASPVRPDRGALRRVIAQIDVTFSNSLIEAWWRALKHRCLFLHPLDNLATFQSSSSST
jgi:hypothetical protein